MKSRAFIGVFAAATQFATAALAQTSNLPLLEHPRISADGTTLSFVQTIDGGKALAFSQPRSGTPPTAVGLGDVKVNELQWVSGDRVIVMMTYNETAATRSGLRNLDIDRWSSISRSGGDATTLFTASRDFDESIDAAQFISTLPSQQNEILMSHRQVEDTQDIRSGGQNFRFERGNVRSEYNLYRVNIRNGREKNIFTGDAETVQWVTDRNGEPVAQIKINTGSDEQLFYTRRDGSDRFVRTSALALGDDDRERFQVLSAGDTPGTVIGLRDDANGVSGLDLYNMTTGSFEGVILRDADADIAEIQFDPANGALVSARVEGGEPVYFDPTLRAPHGAVAAALPDAQVTIVSFSTDRNKMIIRAAPANGDALYYLYDHASAALMMLGRSE